jgi:hypothetical protein
VTDPPAKLTVEAGVVVEPEEKTETVESDPVFFGFLLEEDVQLIDPKNEMDSRAKSNFAFDGTKHSFTAIPTQMNGSEHVQMALDFFEAL